MLNISKYFNEAEKSIFLAGKILKKYYLESFKIEYKGTRNPVTAADKNSEKAIIKILGKKFPDIDFLCEESCGEINRRKNGLVWIIDPLDGTVNFIHKLPVFSISLALYDGNKALFGIVYNPISGEFFHAIKSKGAYFNGKKIGVSKINDLKHSLVVTGFPYDYEKRQKSVDEKFRKFCLNVEGLRRLGSASIDMCYVACGWFDGFWEEGLKPWDVAAGAIIVKEAGGNVTDFAGEDNYLFGETLVASNSKIHNQMVEITGGRK
ncbi:MAG: inositol monophosphatase family protein [Elusimicrobiota bacterium]